MSREEFVQNIATIDFRTYPLSETEAMDRIGARELIAKHVSVLVFFCSAHIFNRKMAGWCRRSTGRCVRVLKR